MRKEDLLKLALFKNPNINSGYILQQILLSIGIAEGVEAPIEKLKREAYVTGDVSKNGGNFNIKLTEKGRLFLKRNLNEEFFEEMKSRYQNFERIEELIR